MSRIVRVTQRSLVTRGIRSSLYLQGDDGSLVSAYSGEAIYSGIDGQLTVGIYPVSGYMARDAAWAGARFMLGLRGLPTG